MKSRLVRSISGVTASVLVLALCVVLTGQNVMAEKQGSDNPIVSDLGEVVVSADLVPTPIRETGSSVTVITSEDIEKRKASSPSMSQELHLIWSLLLPSIRMRNQS